MRINDFFQKFTRSEEFRKKSRLLVVPNDHERTLVCDNFRNSSFVEEVRVSDCISRNDFLSAPPKLFSVLKDKIQAVNQNGHIALVLGVDAILNLWSADNIAIAYTLIQNALDSTVLHCLLITKYYGDAAQNTFRHPKYEGGQAVLHLGLEASSSEEIKKITFVATEFSSQPISGRCLNNLKHFLQEYENNTLAEGEINILVDYHGASLAGINDSIVQVISKTHFLKNFHALQSSFSLTAINWIYEKISSSGLMENALSFAQRYFFPTGINSKETLSLAPGKIRLAQPAEREILIQVLRMSLSGPSYLAAVLSDPNMDEEHFTEFYVCEVFNLLTDSLAFEYASERKMALNNIGVDLLAGEMATFIKRTKEYPLEQIALWLNTQSLMEKHELIRRIMSYDGQEIPDAVFKAYPLLQDYMEPYQLGYIELNHYFTTYRLQKLKNYVTNDFSAKALQVIYPPHGINSRDELVKRYSKESDTALLVVDALGAEYLPMLLSLAKKRSLGILYADTAYSKLPTATEFNSIKWESYRKLPEIKAFDAVIHNGAELHAVRPAEENFVALLELFETKILAEVAKALTSYNQVVLTSDHGASRLAVCACLQNQCQTIPLPDNCQIDDWRYTTAIPGNKLPLGAIENLSGTHWVVKGYNRFPKKGGKLHELHGGATYEECLVPFIVFKQGATFVPKTQQTQHDESEFIENSDFDL